MYMSDSFQSILQILYFLMHFNSQVNIASYILDTKQLVLLCFANENSSKKAGNQLHIWAKQWCFNESNPLKLLLWKLKNCLYFCINMTQNIISFSI